MTRWKYLIKCVKEFCLQTNINGFNHIAMPRRHWLERVLWVLISGSAIWGVVEVSLGQFQRYNENPTVVTLEKDFRSWRFALPGVTICDQDRVNPEKMVQVIKKHWQVKPGDNKYAYYSRFVTTVANSDLFHLDGYQEFMHDEELDVDLYQLTIDVSPEQQVKTTWSRDITAKWTPVMTEAGVCYSINSVATADVAINNTGIVTFDPFTCKYSSLSCYVMFESPKPIDIYVHSPYDIMELTSLVSRTFLTLNRITELSVMETRTGREVRILRPQRRRCLYNDEPMGKDRQVYSTNTCRLSCRIKLALRLCGCRPFYYFYAEGKPCDVAGMWCLAGHSQQLANFGGVRCVCNQQCVDAVFREISIVDQLWDRGPFQNRAAVRFTVQAPRTRYTREIVFHFEDLVDRVCISTSNPVLCQSLDKDGSRAVCQPVESRIDCALRLARNSVDVGVFSEEEMMLLSQMQPNDNRVIATIRDVSRPEPYAFEAVAVVPNSHTGGLEGLRGGNYCHPGFDEAEVRWSPRVLKTFERVVARTDRCPDANVAGKTAEELELETLTQFFPRACRPGPWSANTTVDANLKGRFSSLCSLCGENSGCSQYTLDMGVNVAGVSNNNRHIQALECLRTNGNNSVAYVAWQHVREYFTSRNPQDAEQYSLLCEDGTLSPLTPDILSALTSPCAFVRQPWSAIVAASAIASTVQASMRSWWPNGANPGGNTWQAILFNGIIGGTNARVIFDDTLPSPANYTSAVRNITNIDATTSCLPARRWCTISIQEHTKCMWLRTAAYTLGIEPAISCQQRTNTFECLQDIKDERADFIATPANYGYISRQHYQLSAIKLVQNTRSDPAAFSRVVALIKDSQQDITRFENLRNRKACFPEFGGIAYMAFVNAAQERGVLSASECDYARVVGEFFNGTCAPGAIDATHAISESSTFDAKTLCSVCKPTVTVAESNFTCAYDYTNMYYGNNGSLACLADPETDVAFVEMQNIDSQLSSLGIQGSQFRALCRNNTLAIANGTAGIDQACLLAYVVDSELLARRSDPLLNSLSVLLDNLDQYFGYNAASGTQHINLEMFSAFDGINDLLFKNTAVGLSEPSTETANEPARNYIELFKHLDACTSVAPPSLAKAARNYSMITLFLLTALTRVFIF